MKNYEVSKIIRSSFLFLVISFLTLANTFISKAQSKATTPNLEGTGWRVVTTNLYPTASIVPPEVVYVFEGQGVTISIDSDPLGIDPVGIPRVQTSARGTYSQSGNSVHIEFSDHVIDAKIEGDSLIGEFKNKVSGEKAKWSAVGQLTNKSKRANQTSGVSDVTSSSFSVSANNAFLGTWKYVKYMEQQQYPGIKTTPVIEKMVTLTFHQSGFFDFKLQTAFVGGVSFQEVNDKLNWKYIPQTDSTGVLEQYKENRLVNKSSVKWINNNKFEIASAANPNGERNIFAREGNNPNNFRSLIESARISPSLPIASILSSLSMKERLPVQLGQFKRWFSFLNTRCYAPIDLDEGIPKDLKTAKRGVGIPQVGDPNLESDINRECTKDEVEMAGAFYNELGYISVYKYENSAKAAESMTASIRLHRLDSYEIVKREAVKNRAGQTVGTLVVLQSTQHESEQAVFTFGLYRYEILSKRGDAQKVRLLLPLE